MAGEHGQGATVADDGDRLLADRHVVAELRLGCADDARRRRTPGPAAAGVPGPIRRPTRSSKKTIRPVVGRTCATASQPSGVRGHPQHQVGEGQVGQQLPVTDQQVQPLGLLRSQRGPFAQHVGQGGHGPEPECGPGPAARPAQVVADPLRMTPRRRAQRHRQRGDAGVLDPLDARQRGAGPGERVGVGLGPLRRSARPRSGRGRWRQDRRGERLQHGVQVVAQRTTGQGVPAVVARQPVTRVSIPSMPNCSDVAK